MAGLVVTIGGRLDATYEASLARSLALAKASAIHIQSEYAKAQRMIGNVQFQQFNSLTGLGRSSSSTVSNSREIKTEAENYGAWWVAALNLKAAKESENHAAAIAGHVELRRIEEERVSNMLANFEKQRVANVALKVEQLAAASIIARGFGSAAAIRGGHGRGGSPAGVVSEVAVIGHEIVQGRGTGRILGSISILGQRLGWLRKIIKTTADADVDAAVTMGKLSQSAAADALAMEEKAAATTVANGATIKEVKAAQSAAAASLEHSAAIEKETVALVEKAEISRATATIEKGSISTIVGGVIVVIAIIALLIAAYRELKSILKDKAEAEKYAANASLEHSLSMKEELDALEKLSDAMKKTTAALQEMNEAKDDMVETTQNAIKAMEDEASARDALNDSKKEGDLLDIDIAEKQGQLSRTDAIRARADVEMNAIAEKALNKQADLQDKASTLKVAAGNAETLAGMAQSGAYLAADKLNQSPQGMQNAQDLSEAEKSRDADLKEAADAREEAADHYGTGALGTDDEKGRQGILDRATQAEESAKVMDGIVSAIKANMSPDQVSAAGTLKDSKEKTDAWHNLQKQLTAAQTALAIYTKNLIPQINADQDNVKKKADLEKLSGLKGPEGLNQMQKLGAFTAQGGNPLVPLAQRQVSLLQQLVANSLRNKNRQGGVTH